MVEHVKAIPRQCVPRFYYLFFAISMGTRLEQTMLCALIRQYYRSVILLIAVNMDFIWEFIVQEQ